MFGKIFSTALFLVIILFPRHLYNAPPRKPHFFYNNITQHPYCAGYTEEDDDDSLECDGYWAGGGRKSPWKRSYLWSTGSKGAPCCGCVTYLADNTPTLWFNLADDDGTGESLWCELEIAPDQNFLSPVIRYRSRKLTIGSGNSLDWEYTVGQEARCDGDNCGRYEIGSPSTALHRYGVATQYYWRIRACNSLAPLSGRCNSADAGPWLCNGGGPCVAGGKKTGRSTRKAKAAFGYAPYFINADDGDNYYETVGAVTDTSAQVVVVTPHQLDSFSIQYGTDIRYGNETTPHPRVTGAIKTDLAGLRADTLYHYRIQWTKNGATGYGRDRTFRTARNQGRPFTFVITADSHLLDFGDFYDIMTDTLKPLLESVGADFWVDLGDLIGADIGVHWTPDHANALYTRALWGINTIAHSLPFIPVVGNHEMINQYYGSDGCPFGAGLLDIRCQDVMGVRYGNPLAAYQGSARISFFPLYDHAPALPDPDYKTFFAWEWGDALCIALDPFLYTTEFPTCCDGIKPVFTLGEVQKNWLLDLLHHDNHTWKFIFMHQHGGQPPSTQYWGAQCIPECYGRGGAATVESSIQYQEWIRDLTDRHQVVIFLGHDHVFSTGIHQGIRFVTCPTINNYAQWPFDEVGFRGEDWIYQEEATFSATVVGVGMGQGRVYVKDYTPPPPASYIYKNFAGLTLRNYGQEGKPKRLQRYLKTIDPGKRSKGYDNGFSATSYGGYLAVTRDGEKPEVDHSLAEWEVGDQIAVHRAAGGVLRVDVGPDKVEIRMLDVKGNPVVYPDRYAQAGEEVKVTICAGQDDEQGG